MKVYLDHHSTTPCDPRVVRAMEPYFYDCFGNPSAVHAMGDDARDAIENAREQVAHLINADCDKVFFTSGATASNNIILQGLLLKCRRILGPTKSVDIISSKIEHISVLKCLQEMRYRDEVNHNTIYLDVNEDGNIDLEKLDSVLEKSIDTLVVSIMAANNEIGTINDIAAVGALCKKHNVFFHTDATQAIGKVDIDVDQMNIDALSLSGHKIYGPKGIGAIYIKNSNKILPLINGGYQETVTSGTVNVPGAVGLGKACDILKAESKEENKRIYMLRNKLLDNLQNSIDGIIINGTMKNRLPNNLNIAIKGIKAEALVLGMDDVIVSSGSSCSARSPKASHVIEALNLEDAECAIRLSLGRWTTEQEIEYASNRIISIVRSIRGN